MSVSAIILTVLGAGVLSTVSYMIVSKLGSKKNIIEAVHDVIQKIGTEKIDKLTEEQEVVKKKIEDRENLSNEARTQIVEIKKKASVEITEVLKKDKISGIQKEIDDEWKDL